jgi:hypothetical protein
VSCATHVAGPFHPFGVESWDVTLHGAGFEALSSGPFSFAGQSSGIGSLSAKS